LGKLPFKDRDKVPDAICCLTLIEAFEATPNFRPHFILMLLPEPSSALLMGSG
jgi:hypothetical protein